MVGSRKTEPRGQAGPRERGGYAVEAARAGRGCCAPLARLRRGPMHLGRQGRVSAEATRYALRGIVSPRRVSDAPGGYWLARCGGRVTLARPPVLRAAFSPGGLGGRGAAL